MKQFALTLLVAMSAALFVLQPLLSSNKTVEVLGVSLIAGAVLRSFSCGFADVINEVYGLAAARMNVAVSMSVRLLSWLFIGLIVALPGEVKNAAFLDSLFISFRLVVAGLVGLLLIELLMDAYLFDWLRRKLPLGFWFRTNLTNALNHLTASFVVLGIGFWGTGRDIVALALGGLIAKIVLGFVLTPVFSGLVWALRRMGCGSLDAA